MSEGSELFVVDKGEYTPEEVSRRNASRGGADSFRGARFGYSKEGVGEIAKKRGTLLEEDSSYSPSHATRWRNRRPICPYGCGEEGTLLEVVMRDGKAVGIYTHSESIRPFTADLQMAPKPTGRKIVIGPDGEPMYSEGAGK